MKKYFLSLAAAILTLGFTACEDVPAPYEVNGEGGNTESNVIIDEKFSTSLGDFSAINTKGDFSWNCSYGCVQVKSFFDTDGDGQNENVPAESWLISPQMDFTNVENAYVSFDYILRYANASELQTNYQVLVSKDFKGLPTEANWTALPFKPTNGQDWDTWYKSGDLSIPAEFMKQAGVTVALLYKTTTKAATWEVKNFKVMKGTGEENPGETPEPGGKNLLENGDFETWTDGAPNAWKSTNSASNAKLTQSSEARNGKFALAVEGLDAQNKRLASKEYTLKAGTYKFTIYVKGEGQVRPGYAIVEADGSIAGGDSYKYGDYTSTTAGDWTEVTYTFKLDAQTKVNLVMMNPKTSSFATASEKLVDDASLVTSDGGLVDGEQGGDTPVEPSGNNLLENGGFEAWTSGVPDAWKSTNSASSAKLTQSSEARNGKFALAVEGMEAQNKRLASKEYTLKAGTYKFTIYVKGEGQVRPGYAIVEADGSIAGGDSYKYGDYTSTTAGDRTEVTYTFKLDAQTKVNLVMMNPKTSSYATASEKLVDDASLVTSDGGLVEGGDQGGEQGGGDEKPEQPQVGNLLENAGFELWSDNAPTAWKSTNSASNATLTQSTEARNGKLAVAVGFDEKQNKRLASKEYTLKAGTYTFTLYVKGDGQVRPGYAIVGADGSIAGGDSYKYGGYISTTAGEWTKVTYEFTLTQQTKVNFVMMNPKTSSYATASEKLVDDASLTTTDGGIVG